MSTYQKKRFLEILSQKTLPKLEELNDLMLKREFTSKCFMDYKGKKILLDAFIGKEGNVKNQNLPSTVTVIVAFSFNCYLEQKIRNPRKKETRREDFAETMQKRTDTSVTKHIVKKSLLKCNENKRTSVLRS